MKPTAQLIATDIVLFHRVVSKTWVLLIQRKNEPFKNAWALPGGFVEPDEDVMNGALRELKEETSIALESLTLTGVYGKPDRDPRGRVISCAFAATVNTNDVKPEAADDAKNVGWFDVAHLPNLAFDHDVIISEAIEKIEQ